MTASVTNLVVRRLSETPCAPGESPVWNERLACHWWIGGDIGAIGPAEEGRLILSCDHAFRLLDPETGRAEILLAMDDADPSMRLNDAKTDRQGRFVCAGMGRAVSKHRDGGHLFATTGTGAKGTSETRFRLEAGAHTSRRTS